MDPWQFLSVESSEVPNSNEYQEDNKLAIQRTWHSPGERMPPLPVQYNVHQLLSMQLTTVQGNVSSVNIHKYANVKKQTPPYLPKLNQQQQSKIVTQV